MQGDVVGLGEQVGQGQELHLHQLGALVQVDDEDGRSLAVDAAYAFGPATRLELHADTSDASAASTSLATRGYGLRLTHDLGVVELGGGVSRWEDPDVVVADELAFSVGVRGAALSATASVSLRRSEFEPFAADTTVRLGNGRLLPIRALASCDLMDMGYGLRLAWSAPGWGAWGSARTWRYDDVECGFSSPGLDALANARTAEFRQFATLATAALATGAGRRVGAENALLDRSFAAGAWWQPERFGLAADVGRTRDHVTGDATDTVTASLLWAATPALDLEFTLGATDSELLGGSAFAGLGVRTRF